MVAKMTESTRAAGFMPSESGIILPIPEAETAVGHLRRLHDPQASYGVPAHITLLYPFAHPSRVDEAAGALQKLFCLVRAFEFSLVEVRRFPATAYLHPEPSATFVQLTKKLVHRWARIPAVWWSVFYGDSSSDRSGSCCRRRAQRDRARRF